MQQKNGGTDIPVSNKESVMNKRNSQANTVAEDEARGIRFSEDKSILLKYNADLPDETYAIPAGVTTIGDNAFFCCPNLMRIIIPASVTSIGEWAFAYCMNLKKLNIPEGVTFIGSGAFSSCINWKSVKIPTTITSIGKSVFAHCGLIRAHIPEGVRSIGDYAFAFCDLMDVTIPKTVTHIGQGAFASRTYSGLSQGWTANELKTRYPHLFSDK